MFDSQLEPHHPSTSTIRSELHASSEADEISRLSKQAYTTGYELVREFGELGEYTNGQDRDDEYIRQALTRYGKKSNISFPYAVIHPKKLDETGKMSPRIVVIPNGKPTELESALVFIESPDNYGARVLTTGHNHTSITEESLVSEELGSPKKYEELPLTSNGLRYFTSQITGLHSHLVQERDELQRKHMQELAERYQQKGPAA